VSRVVVVGSGASGVHFALTALELGHQVTLVDVGRERPAPVLRDATFSGLKEQLDDPLRYFLGETASGVVFPDTAASYYGHPPSMQYAFDVPGGFDVQAAGMKPRFSFAQGGLAEAWTGGAYTYNRDDLAPFPVSYEDMARHYDTVVSRVGIGAERDDLAAFIPWSDAYRTPLPLDRHSQRLWDRYHRRRATLNAQHRFHLGRSRVATLSSAKGERGGCRQLGRCLWGCPTGAIYSPAHTLRDCLAFPRFEHVTGVMARWLEYGEQGAVQRLIGRRVDDGQPVTVDGDLFVLAAGALPTSKLVLESHWRATGEVATLRGLMDNLQIHVPFLTLAAIGDPVRTDSYQYHHLAFGVTRENPLDYVHGQITTLKSASIHPIVQTLPLDLRSALQVFRSLRAALAVANVNLPDQRRDTSTVTLRPRGTDGAAEGDLVIDYRSADDEPEKMRAAVQDVSRALRAMGCFVPPGMSRVLPKGTSVHYAGTLPYSTTPAPFACDPQGRSWDHRNLLIADGATMPFLPAKNHTFMLMVNATRMATALGPA
jgi:choline dehydrogenase-like flavoprotein